MKTILVGTTGQSVFRSNDGGDSFKLSCKGMFEENKIYTLVKHPTETDTVYAGADDGVYRSTDRGSSWTLLSSAFDNSHIWSLVFAMNNSDVMFAGTGPAALFKSYDGGMTWTKCDMEAKQKFVGRNLFMRVTKILPHITDPQVLFAGIERDGIRRSRDSGLTWERTDIGLTNDDIHDLIMLADGTLLATTEEEIFRSRNGGDSWTSLNVKQHFPWQYCRGMSCFENTLLVGVGNGAPGNIGAIYKTEDAGDSWALIHLNAVPNSTIWQFTSSGSWILASSLSGHLFRSTNRGLHWAKLSHEFGEIRGLLCFD